MSSRHEQQEKATGICFLAVLFLGMVLIGVPAYPQSATDDILIGTWEARRVIGPRLAGPVDIWQNDAGWSASVNAEIAPGTRRGGLVQFDFGASETLKLRLDDSGIPIMGAWVQPPVAWLGSMYVSPVRIQESSGVWSGQITPAPDVVTLRLKITRDDSGELNAMLFNPEHNIGKFVQVASARLDGESVELLGTLPGDRSKHVAVLRGEIHTATGPTLTLYFEFLYPDGAFTFNRVDRQPVQGGTYRPPPSTGDGWPVGNAAEFGIDLEKLAAYRNELARLANDDVAGFKPHAFLMARSGVLVIEDYFEGHHRDLTHDTRSATKTIASILAGAAAHNGVPVSSDTLVYDAIFDGAPPGGLDPRALRITLEHLMTMTSGLDCDDWDASSPGNEGAMQTQTDHPDWSRFTLALDMKHDPGAHAAYCAGSSNIVGAVVRKIGEKASQEQFDLYIAQPLQINQYQMNLMANGEAYFGGGMRFKPRDFAKFGQLYIDGGIWNGRRVLTEDWIQRSVEPAAFLYDDNDWHDPAIGYGYLWWTYDYAYGDDTVQAFYMAGNGGQYVFVVPALELVVVLMAGSYGDLTLFAPRDDHMPDWILPMVR